MELVYLQDDIKKFKFEEGVLNLIINGVNTKNAFGKGFAGAIAERWPKVKSRYHSYPKKKLGVVYPVLAENDVIVANCFTQKDYGYDGKVYADVTAIEKCLRICFDHAYNESRGDRTVNIIMPRIGSGYGGLDWEDDVFPIVLKFLESHASDSIKLIIIGN